MKRVFQSFLIASSMVAALMLLSCSKKQPVKTPDHVVLKPQQIISEVNHFAAQGKYNEAMDLCADFFQKNIQSPVLDRALFHCGLLAALDQNPQKNYPQSVHLLQRIAVEFPGSDYASASRVAIQLIETVNHLQAIQRQLTATLASQEEGGKNLQAEIDRLNQRTARLVETLGQLQRTRSEQARLIEEQANTIKELQSELDKIKRIDLKKRP